ncbi:MAG: type II toxin-antitoxin system VapC family toxin [Patescibacteria group bacterium]
MPTFLLDTNILLLHVAGIERLQVTSQTVAISSVTVFELFRFPGLPEVELNSIREVLDLCLEIPMAHSVSRRAAEISMTRPKMKPLDVFIAATAMVYGLPLVTKNTKDFKGVEGLILRATV